MTQPYVSILLPHLRNASNDAALRVCLDCLVANTGLNFELIMESVEERRDIYTVLNNMAERAATDWLIPFNSDTFPAKNWIEPLWEARSANTIVSPIMVECGAIPVNDLNLERNFGRTPQTFDRSAFETWAENVGGWREDWREDQASWFFPSLIERDAFLANGGFDTSRGSFPNEPLDIFFWDKWKERGGKFRRVRSYIYHLQIYSDPSRGVRDAS